MARKTKAEQLTLPAHQHGADIREIIDAKALKAKTRRLDLSFNELLDMYKAQELTISPDFQRVFAWNIERESQFIESLLLELPVPPIYVVEVDEGKYELVDGLQRLSSYFHFRGSLDNSYREIEEGDTFALTGCDIAKELNGLYWKELGTALQIRLKRAFITVQVIRRESDKHYKYYMFKRLNSGGIKLSAHQIRNATIRMLGSDFLDFVKELSRNSDFKASCVACLTEEALNLQVDEELVLRFFAMKNWRQEFKHDVDNFLTGYMERVSDPSNEEALPFDYAAERTIFEKTFAVFNAATGDVSFTFPNKTSSALTQGFSVYHFEGATLGVQKWLSRLDPSDDDQIKRLKDVLVKTRLSSGFGKVSRGGGKNSPGPLANRIRLIEHALGTLFREGP